MNLRTKLNFVIKWYQIRKLIDELKEIAEKIKKIPNKNDPFYEIDILRELRVKTFEEIIKKLKSKLSEDELIIYVNIFEKFVNINNTKWYEKYFTRASYYRKLPGLLSKIFYYVIST
ncbi:hypothetical protein JN00_0286 [Metamycoplasma subdolum]|uniref:Uncharacterized protein n=1 Tax=Metamycoplasma subdolum TaxID=92407 RepID=A0A3M0A2H0_9BACT|nr:hypothetical protein [Metamycoplasma subdolum]RMA78644.1 hypothetical protein JN00_0286 [Metamycoplasma subdolum]WPB50754.1 hypothetical protein R9C05_01240 [Metamycoplasma subdolum]